MIRPVVTACITALTVTACAQFPQLDASIPDHARDADYPILVPLENLDLVGAQGNALIVEARGKTAQNLAARANGLRARAARLRGPVLDRPTKRRMRRGIRQP